MLTTPLACTPSGPVAERVLQTEDHGVVVCPGFVRWGLVDGMRLDVDRYPTIIEIEVDRRPVASHEPGLSGPHLSRAQLMRLRGRVLSVVSGSAPVGAAEFSVLTLANWNVDMNYGDTRALQGGWPWLRHSYARPRGLVFLPVAGIDDLAMLGCAEGHVVWLQDEAGEAYLRDLRRIAALDRNDLASEALPLSRLRSDGGPLLGAFVAEYAPVESALSTLEDATEVTPFDHGLVRGLRRMLAITATGRYPAPAWKDTSASSIRARLDTWSARWGIEKQSPIDHGAGPPCLASGPFSASSRLLREAAGPHRDTQEDR